MRSLLALFAVSFVGCVAATGDEDLDEDDETLVVPGSADERGAQAATPQLVFVNFGGPVIVKCRDGSGYCQNSAGNESSMISLWGKSSIDFAAYTSTTGRDRIMSLLRGYYSKYNVTLTTSRPASGTYAMLVITPTAVGSTSLRGKSYTDCYNSLAKNDIGFVVRIGSTTPEWIAKYAAHELGHMLGLLHVTPTGDLMQYKSSGSAWTNAAYDNANNPKNGDGTPFRCTTGSTQNEPALLTAAVGLK